MSYPHRILVADTNATSFQRYCCQNLEIDQHIDGEIESLPQILNATRVCFADLNITAKTHFKIIQLFASGACKYKVEDCHLYADPCNATPSTVYVSYICLWVALWLVMVSSNTLVVMAVRQLSYLRENVGNYLIASLALSDLCVGLLVIPVKIKFAYRNLYFCSKSLCRYYITADTTLFSISITNIFIISIDRYLALTYPYKYQAMMTLSRCRLIIAGIWMFGSACGLLSNFNWSDFSEPSFLLRNYQCLQNNNIYTMTSNVVVFYIPVIAMAIIYIRILNIARYHAQVISGSVLFRNNNTENAETRSRVEAASGLNAVLTGEARDSVHSTTIANGRAKELNKTYSRRSFKGMQLIRYRKIVFKASKTVAIVYCTFFICWFPVSVLSFTLSYCGRCLHGPKLKWFYVLFVEILPVFNSTMNPFIYAIMNKQFRRSYKIFLYKLKIASMMSYFRSQEKSSTSYSGEK